MRRMPIPNLVLAAALALLLPLEQAHCAWMGFQRHAAPVTASSASGHECCSSRAASRQDQPAHPERDATGCVCEALPAGTLPLVITARAEAPSAAVLAIPTAKAVIAPVSVVRQTAPAPDVGSSPLPDDPGAHGLRAPPVSA
jgi:hypothetical protein